MSDFQSKQTCTTQSGLHRLPCVFDSHAHVPFTVCSKERKLLKSMKFPKEFETKLDLRHVNWEAMKGWIAKRVTELLGVEDEVLIAYIFEQLEGKQVSHQLFQSAGEYNMPHGSCSVSLACCRLSTQGFSRSI